MRSSLPNRAIPHRHTGIGEARRTTSATGSGGAEVWIPAGRGMGAMMNAVTRSRSCASVPSGRLPLVLAAAAFVLAALSGNSFSLHIGMAATAGAHDVAPGLDRASHVVAKTATTLTSVPGKLSDRGGPMTAGSDPQHVMHLVGACLAVLAAAAVLRWLTLVRRALTGGYPAVTGAPRPPAPVLARSWSPPAPSPPTSSPVIRT